jgi:hypothetical protein
LYACCAYRLAVLLETGRQSVSDPSPLLPTLSAASTDVAVASASAQTAAAAGGGGAFEGLLLSRSALLTAAATSTAATAAVAAAQTMLAAAPAALLLALCVRPCDTSDDAHDEGVQLRRVTALESHLSAAGLHRALLPLLGVLLREGKLVPAAAASGCDVRELAAERAAVRQQRMVRVAECYVAEAGRAGAAGDSLLAAKLLGAAAQWFVTAANR